MAQVPSPETKSPELPTIIIDPSLYEPELRTPAPTVSGGFARLSRVTIAIAAVGAATYGIAQMRGANSILPRAQVSALTSLFTGGGNVLTDQPAPGVAAALVPEPAPTVQETPTGTTAALDESPAATVLAAADGLPAQPAAEPPVAEPEAEVLVARALTAMKPVAEKPAPAADLNDPASALTASAKAMDKGAAIEGDVRNARRLLALNRLDQAEAAYRKVLSLKDGEPAALTGLARVQLARGQLDDALTSAMRAVAEAPQTAGTHLTLGDVLRARGDKSGAQAHYDQASQLRPNAEP